MSAYRASPLGKSCVKVVCDLWDQLETIAPFGSDSPEFFFSTRDDINQHIFSKYGAKAVQE